MSALRRQVAAAVLLSIVLRLRFVAAPLSDAEGALATAGRVWSSGGVLYRDVWVDRPQGAVVLVRAWSAVASVATVRWVAVAAGAVMVVGVAGAARAVALAVAARRGVSAPAPERVASIAALVAAGWSASPALLGFTASTALVGTSLAVVGLWLSMEVVSGRAGAWAGVVAGCCCGSAASVDLFAAAVALAVPSWLAVACLRRSARVAASSTLRLVGIGAAAPLALLLVHTALVGVSPWWDGVVSARLLADEPQDWLTVVPIVATVIAFAVALLPHPWWRAVAVSALLVPVAWSVGTQVARTDERIDLGDTGRGSAQAESVGRWVATNTEPGERLLAMCSGAAVYAYADRSPAMPYLTASDLRRAAVPMTVVVELLEGPDRPETVVVFDPPAECGSPSLVGALASHYEQVTVIDGVPVMRAVGG